MSPKLVTVLYGHPESYPPTLNALRELSPLFARIAILFRPHMPSHWAYPANVRLHPSGPRISASEQQASALGRRYGIFAGFVRDLALLLRRERPDAVLIYDPLGLLAYALARRALRSRPLLWYHNHDVIDLAHARPGSLAWFALHAQRAMFPALDMFSLPAVERESHFPMASFQGRKFFLPNLPSLRAMEHVDRVERTDSALRLVFQGRIGAGRGILEVLALMPAEIRGRAVHLTLVGRGDASFLARVRQEIEAKQLADAVTLFDFVPYGELGEVTARCDVGLAVYTGDSAMDRTVGTASNKIYEYAAFGLPVLYRGSEHFRAHLAEFSWAVPVDLDPASLRAALEHIVDRYTELSRAARSAFEERLHYERHFEPLRAHLERALAQRSARS